MQTTRRVRSTFLDYFSRNGHEVIPSSPLVPQSDPSLLFTNAGMVPFKNVFTGHEKRPYQRAASAQKCIRAGGKHNDLENVGYTARHHTFFEMLGNFSFGDYFKEEAIFLAWKFITQEIHLSPSRLCVTVYSEDEEAFSLWRRISGLEERRIIRIETNDNFWSMGETGPCGPCSEIFYDHGEEIPGGPPGTSDQEGDRFVEIWNLVFMQYEQRSARERVLLPNPSIDTGMGLERISAVLQGVHDNYDTDTLKALVEACADLTACAAKGPSRFSHRVIADHVRSAGFLIADGVLPGNEGRGHVLRRILRRAMRHVHLLGYRGSLLSRLVPTLVCEMKSAYPELERAEPLMIQTLDLEHKRFQESLERGLGLLLDETRKLAPSAVLPGEVAFKLYDTYGFPLDLTEDILKEQGRLVDAQGFHAAMERQKTEARASWVGSGEAATDQVYFDLCTPTAFLGYQMEEAHARLDALVIDGKRVPQAHEGALVSFFVNQTPFYGESGGQVGDSGWVTSAKGAEAEITNTQKKRGLHVHLAKITKGVFSQGEEVALLIDGKRRAQIRANHSATHLLHKALRRLLGDHVTQKGSLVSPDRLRFDFSHQGPLRPEEIRLIEEDVNAQIRRNCPVLTRLMSQEEALKAGALALFGEKYEEEVRVISMGTLGDQPFSVELCGGTHVERTGDIGFFKIISEGGLASGVRRIEAMTGVALERQIALQEDVLNQCAALLKTPASSLCDRISQLIDEQRGLKRELSKLRGGGLTQGAGDELDVAIHGKCGDIPYIIQQTEGLSSKALKGVVDQLKGRIKSGVVVLINREGDFREESKRKGGGNGEQGSREEGKSALLIGVTGDLTPRISAALLIQKMADFLGGKGGGGRLDLAQTRGPSRENVADFIDFFKKTLEALLKGPSGDFT